MKLHQVTAINFMPYKGPSRLDFPTEDAHNVMIVFGENTRGKTSLLNAIRWAFYGKAFGRHSRLIPLQNLVNKDAAAEDDWRMEVFVTFESDGRNYELRRTAERRPHVATPSRSEDFLVSTYLTRDGMVLSGNQIEPEINQIAPEKVSRFFLFDGELLSQYEELLIEGSEQGRQIKDAIEQVLGVPALINGRNELGAILKAATKRQSQDMAHTAGLQGQAEQTARLTTKLDSLEEDQKRLVRKIEDTRSDRMRLDEELEAAAVVLSLQARLDAAKTALKTHADALNQKRADRHALLAEAWRDLLDAKLDTKRAILRSRQFDLTEQIGARAQLNSEIRNVREMLETSVCPTCHQDLLSSRRVHLGALLGQLEAQLSEHVDATTDLQTVSAQIEALSGIRGIRARERLVLIDRDMRTAQVGLQRAENDIETSKEEIAGYDTAELARKRVMHGEKLKEEGRLDKDLRGVRADIQKVKEDLAVARKAIESLASARSQRSTQKVALAASLERCFSISVERLRDRLRERVGKLSNEAFRKMTTQKAYQGLEVNDNYGLSILDSAGRRVSVRSAGAEQVVALSLIDGLNRTGRAIGPIIMDTPFGRLDLAHRDNILSYLPTIASQLVLLVHSGEVRRETDLASIKTRIGAVYEIEEITETQSRLSRSTL